MVMGKIGLIVAREYNERVRKKSFIIATLLMPVFMVAMMLAPTLIMMKGGSDTKHIVVVDESRNGFVGERLEPSRSMEFRILEGMTLEQASEIYQDKSEAYGILFIGSNIENDYSNLLLINNTSGSVSIEDEITSQIENILHKKKLADLNIEGLDSLIESTNVHLGQIRTMKNNGTGNEETMEKTSSSISMIISLILGMTLYMILLLYGQMVMTSVIEEKQSRVIDVLVTSCSPFEMMMGKMLGIAAVAATQIILWGIIVMAASQMLLPIVTGSGSVDLATIEANPMMTSITDTLGNTLFILKMFGYMLLFLLGGFFFYASLYAAIGSAVDNTQDAQQFVSILVMPIILAIIIMMQAFNDPNGKLIFWCSMIPFTSPIVMMARIPFDIPDWQPILSLAILILSFIGSTWIAAKIYRVGIFMHGKKPTWKELMAWIRQK